MSANNQDKLKKQLKELLKLQENKYCVGFLADADCPIKGPTWASVNIGVFVCMPCSGIHRSLGVHITQVRSCDLDTWKPEWLEVMKEWGNTKANAIWEAKMPKHYDGKPSESDAQDLTPKLQRFIRDKYERKKWYGKGKREESDDDEEESEEEEDQRRRKETHRNNKSSSSSSSRRREKSSEESEEEEEEEEEVEKKRPHRRHPHHDQHNHNNKGNKKSNDDDEPDLLSLGNEFESKFNPFDDVTFVSAAAAAPSSSSSAPSFKPPAVAASSAIDLMSLYSTPAYQPQPQQQYHFVSSSSSSSSSSHPSYPVQQQQPQYGSYFGGAPPTAPAGTHNPFQSTPNTAPSTNPMMLMGYGGSVPFQGNGMTQNANFYAPPPASSLLPPPQHNTTKKPASNATTATTTFDPFANLY